MKPSTFVGMALTAALLIGTFAVYHFGKSGENVDMIEDNASESTTTVIIVPPKSDSDGATRPNEASRATTLNDVNDSGEPFFGT